MKRTIAVMSLATFVLVVGLASVAQAADGKAILRRRSAISVILSNHRGLRRNLKR